ncbi:hypothetical protein AB4Z09_13080 [Rhodococcus sp. TAF43]|uniref:DUF7832 domain-containing protein n=1 Tax=unclassified Rhodococcus (in: high G+C Gram-positive bacteria) TaxID=192944 RepID=UPI000E2AF496|nr:hypothetical protein [Rhodococcus sp. AG1013]RDI19430.1 hypothetical protein DEU38_11854 [Rhodococcus sp. AG1013]
MSGKPASHHRPVAERAQEATGAITPAVGSVGIGKPLRDSLIEGSATGSPVGQCTANLLEEGRSLTKYDDADWHYGGIFPDDLPNEAGGTHIGMFVAWCLLSGFAGEDIADELEPLESRESTPGAFLMDVLDEKFVSDDLTADGNAFAVAYYAGEHDDSCYLVDYLDAFGTTPTEIYRVEDSWETYDVIADRIGARFHAWLDAGRPQFVSAR